MSDVLFTPLDERIAEFRRQAQEDTRLAAIVASERAAQSDLESWPDELDEPEPDGAPGRGIANAVILGLLFWGMAGYLWWVL